MASAGWFRGRNFELIHSRSLLVRVNPTPSNLTERRAVLHALQHHGTVEVFKRLPTPSTFVCAFVKGNEALNMYNKSPLTFKLVSEPLESIRSKSAPGVNPVGVAAPINIHFVEADSETIKREQTDPSTAESDPIKTFTMWVQRSGSRYNHKTNIRRNPIHGHWPEVKKEHHDFTYHALKEVVPDSIAQHGLCDWTTGGQLSEDAKLARLDEENNGNVQIRDRIQRRRNRERVSADAIDLTSWTSLKSALQPETDAFAEAFEPAFKPAFKPADEPTEKPIHEPTNKPGNWFADEDIGAETISEPLRTNNSQSQALDSQQDSSQAEDTPSDQVTESDTQSIMDDSMSNWNSRESMQKILDMPKENKAAPAQDPGSEGLPSYSGDQSDNRQIPLDHGRDT